MAMEHMQQCILSAFFYPVPNYASCRLCFCQFQCTYKRHSLTRSDNYKTSETLLVFTEMTYTSLTQIIIQLWKPPRKDLSTWHRIVNIVVVYSREKLWKNIAQTCVPAPAGVRSIPVCSFPANRKIPRVLYVHTYVLCPVATSDATQLGKRAPHLYTYVVKWDSRRWRYF